MVFFSYDHALEVHRESKEVNDDAWDCTLIKRMKEHGDTTVNAIYEWSDADVWDFLNDRGIETNPLYEMGFTRVGCIGCPLAKTKEKIHEFELYPTYKQAYINAFDKMLHDPKFRGVKNENWKSGESIFEWWVRYDTDGIDGQMNITDFL